MSASTFLISEQAAAGASAGGTIAFDGPEAHHAITVQRLKPGEHLDLVDGAGRRISATITDIESKDRCTLEVRTVVDEPAPRPVITAVQAVAKGDRGELAVQMLTEAGIDVIAPWQAENSVARWDGERATKHHAKWATTAREASKQARRSRIPVLEPLLTTAAVADLVANAGVALVLDEQASTPLTSIDISTAHDVLLVIGPEGGVSDNERRLFADSGADLVRLGDTVLRTSTAGVAALGVVMARVGRW